MMHVETIHRERGSLLPLDTLGGTIKAHITAGDKSIDKAEEHYKAAGIHLSEAKERVARIKGTTWPAFLIKHCQIGRRRADELIAMADGRTSLVEVRQAKATSMAASRAKHPAPRGAQSSEIIEQEQHLTFIKTVSRLTKHGAVGDFQVIEAFVSAHMSRRIRVLN